MLDKLVPCESAKDDGFIAPDGCYWKTKLDYLMMDVLPSCGCGDPSLIGRYVKEMLLKCVQQTDSDDCSCWEITQYDDLPTMFFLSWADHEGYIEHGSTIRCSWMTKKGDELLRDLIEVGV